MPVPAKWWKGWYNSALPGLPPCGPQEPGLGRPRPGGVSEPDPWMWPLLSPLQVRPAARLSVHHARAWRRRGRLRRLPENGPCLCQPPSGTVATRRKPPPRLGSLPLKLRGDTRGMLSPCRFPRAPTFPEPRQVSTASSPGAVCAPTLGSLAHLWLRHRVSPERGFPPARRLAHPKVC